MSHMEFNDSLRVGNRVMDQEHETLVAYINLLQDAVENGVSSGVVDNVVHGMVEYAKTHFFVEEELMKAYAYPDAEPHIHAHRKFSQHAGDLLTSLESGDDVDLDAVLAFLMDWLRHHIMKVDAWLADYLRDHGMA